MATAIPSISLFNMGMVCDFVLEEISDVSIVNTHYKHMPVLSRHKPPTPAQHAWFRQEEGRARRYIFLAASIVRQQLLKDPPIAQENSPPTQTQTSATIPPTKPNGFQNYHSESTIPPTAEGDKFVLYTNPFPQTLPAHTQPPKQETTETNQPHNTSNPSNKKTKDNVDNDTDDESDTQKHNNKADGSPSTQPFTMLYSFSPQPCARSPAKHCTLRRDILTHAFVNFPSDVFHHLLYSSMVGMNVSVETMMQATILFSDAVESGHRDTLLGLPQMCFCNNKANTEDSGLSRSSTNSYSPPPSPRASIDSKLSTKDKYGASRMWGTLESQLRRQQQRLQRDKQSCGCFFQLSEEDIHSLQWNLFEAMVACVLGCLVLAVKMGEDSLWSNRCWAKISGFPLEQINMMELALYKYLKSTVWIDSDRYLEFLMGICAPHSTSSAAVRHAQEAVRKARSLPGANRHRHTRVSQSYQSLTALDAQREGATTTTTQQQQQATQSATETTTTNCGAQNKTPTTVGESVQHSVGRHGAEPQQPATVAKTVIDEKRKRTLPTQSQLLPANVNGNGNGGARVRSSLPFPHPQSLVPLNPHLHQQQQQQQQAEPNQQARLHFAILAQHQQSHHHQVQDSNYSSYGSNLLSRRPSVPLFFGSSRPHSLSVSQPSHFHLEASSQQAAQSGALETTAASPTNSQPSNTGTTSPNAGQEKPKWSWKKLVWGSLKQSNVADAAGDEEALVCD